MDVGKQMTMIQMTYINPHKQLEVEFPPQRPPIYKSNPMPPTYTVSDTMEADEFINIIVGNDTKSDSTVCPGHHRHGHHGSEPPSKHFYDKWLDNGLYYAYNK